MLNAVTLKLVSVADQITAAVTCWSTPKRNSGLAYSSQEQARADRDPDNRQQLKRNNSTPPALVPVRLKVNGSSYDLLLDPRVTLLNCLREHLHLTGTKLGCNQGACGACTVLLDGERMNSCLALAVQCDGSEITTIEGLAAGALGQTAQAAFVRHEAVQCGYCTPGQLCSTIAMLAETASATPSAATKDLTSPTMPLSDEEIKERMAGNLCRCGAYNGITAAIRELAQRKFAL
jgi:xanthine dehydrogenase YagT iron-sulfur-binding subunit